MVMEFTPCPPDDREIVKACCNDRYNENKKVLKHAMLPLCSYLMEGTQREHMLLFVRILSIYLAISGILLCQGISHVGCVIYLVPASF